MLPVITAEELLELHGREDVILVDVSNVPDAYPQYLKSHLENAHFLDVNRDLAKVGDPKFGGRHPLQEVAVFTDVMRRIGITKSSHVVAYDKANGANAAARFRWMLRAIGHEKVQVLDGGFAGAIAIGFTISDVVPNEVNFTDYATVSWNLPTVKIDEVKAAISDAETIIIDVRESRRFSGEYEPIDLVAGHIPSAINIPFTNNLNESGKFKTFGELKEIYGPFHHQNTIVHCGSGVTACHTLLAFEIAGLPIPKLYVGSWSEWARNQTF